MTALFEPVRPVARQMEIDTDAMDATRRGPSAGFNGWRQALEVPLNGAPATELVCALCQERHHFTARGLASPRVAEAFAIREAEESVHADRLARRIVQQGGQPDLDPGTLAQRSHAGYDGPPALVTMSWANLAAERVAIKIYSQLERLVGDRDPSTSRLLEDLLSDEQRQSGELQVWLSN